MSLATRTRSVSKQIASLKLFLHQTIFLLTSTGELPYLHTVRLSNQSRSRERRRLERRALTS